MILIGSVMMVSACATTNTAETVANKTDEPSRVVLEAGKFENPPALPQSAATPPVSEPAKSAGEKANEVSQAPATTISRINPKERFVNIRTAPSSKSKIVAVLKGGHSIEILETKDSWLKVKWVKGDVVKQGWMSKRFVDANE
jgi:uncharacterized protein YgiM (DUF1202 family)